MITVGHTKVRCKQPLIETDEGHENGGFNDDGGAGGDFDAAPAVGGTNDWENAAEAPVANDGGGSW